MARFTNAFGNRVEGGNTDVVMGFLTRSVRDHMVAFIAELCGTFLFLFFAFSIAQVANTSVDPQSTNTLPDTSKILFIALGFGCSLTVNVWIFYRVSGGQFNPAV